jgi:small-conductance mechanosensitive channel
MTLSFLNFPIGPYTASLWTVLIWVAVLIATILINKLIKRGLKKYLKRPHLKIKGTRITLLRLLNQVLYFAAFIVAFQAFRIENENISLREFLQFEIVPKVTNGEFHLSMMDVISIIIVFTVSRFLINVFRVYIDRRFKDNADFDEGTHYVYVQLARYVVYTLAVIISIQFMFSNLSVLLAGSAAIFAALALGLQGMFRDVVSGIVLLFEGTIKIGDVVRFVTPVNGKEVLARVLKINVRTSKVVTRDGITLIIPNSILTQDQVENLSYNEELTRFHIDLLVAYDQDVELVKKLLKQAAMGHPEVKKTEPLMVRVINFGEFAFKVELLFWAENTFTSEFYTSDIRFEIIRLFRQYGVNFPYPQQIIQHSKGEAQYLDKNIINPKETNE